MSNHIQVCPQNRCAFGDGFETVREEGTVETIGQRLGVSAAIGHETPVAPVASLILFCGRRSDRIKALYWDSTGHVLLYERLSEKRFQWLRSREKLKLLTQQEFRWLMAGLSIEQAMAFRPGKPGSVC